MQSGVKCWVPNRSESKLDELKKFIPEEFHSNLKLVKADLANEKEIADVRDEILRKEGKINHVVASIGGWRTDGKLSTVTVDQYVKGSHDMTVPHFVCYKTFAKLLSEKPNSTYTFIAGGSGDVKYFDPRASLLPINKSAIYGMYISACSEFKGNNNLALIQLRLYFWIRRCADSKFDPKKSQFEVGHDYVGKFLPKLILKNKSEIYKVQTRSVGDQLFNTL